MKPKAQEISEWSSNNSNKYYITDNTKKHLINSIIF